MSEHWQDRVPLGKTIEYVSGYDPSLLCGVPRAAARAPLGVGEGPLPFVGVDVWTAYELSWCLPDGKPVVRLGEFRIPCDSVCLVESKSLKLYLNALNSQCFTDDEMVRELIAADLSRVAGAPVQVQLWKLDEAPPISILSPGECLDDLPLSGMAGAPDAALLQVDQARQERVTLHSHLLRSCCPVTGQPDWGTVIIEYQGPCIDRSALLSYIVSFREHPEFHEQCVERMFLDIQSRYQPVHLAVYARYLRRGGLDINPFRASDASLAPSVGRLIRQ